MKLYDAEARRKAEIARNAENRARQAAAFAKFSTTGQGGYEFADVVQFQLAFVEEPFMSYGCYIDGDKLADDLDLAADAMPPYPVCTGFVTDWDVNSAGFYTGAWVGVRVYFPPDLAVPVDYGVDVLHHFRWEGVSIKVFSAGDQT